MMPFEIRLLKEAKKTIGTVLALLLIAHKLDVMAQKATLLAAQNQNVAF
jgi:hypothetical protein